MRFCLPLNISRRKTTLTLVSLMILFLLFNPPVSALAAAGDLDHTFGNGGKVVLPASDTSPGSLADVVIQPDGKIVGYGVVRVGPIFSPSFRAGLVRLKPDGTFDEGFGNNGRVLPSLPNYTADFCTLTLQADVKTVLACRSYPSFGPGERGITVFRFNSDGTPDTSFDTDGAVFTILNASFNFVNDIVVQPDGKILVGMDAIFPTKEQNSRFVLLRYNENGSRDTSFGTGGMALSPERGVRDDYLSNLLILPNGKIVAAGSTSPANFFLLFGFNADGTLDTSFGTNGEVKTQLGNFSHYGGNALLQPDGKIMRLSGTNNAAYPLVLLRYNPNGTLDASFGTNGVAALQAAQNIGIRWFARQADGKFLVTGSIITGSTTSNLLVGRINSAGAWDASFGTNGIVITSGFGLGGSAFGNRVTTQADGKILVAGGNSYDKHSNNPILTRYRANGTREFDFEGDRKSDVSIFRPNSSAEWYWLNSSTNQSSGLQFGIGSDKIVPADYDGDGKSDIAVFRDGDWYRLNSSDNQFVAVHFGQTGDLPVPSDYDGDARADLAVYRQGNWYILNSADDSFRADQFGIATDKPIIGDFDSDGKNDLAVYRNGVWYEMRSQQGFYAEQFGISSDKPSAADYDGDGKTDLAVYRPSDGTWYLLQTHLGFTAQQFGISTDKPVPADYDGDGKADIAVYRDGNWYVQQSREGFRAVEFGTASDVPIPNAFVP